MASIKLLGKPVPAKGIHQIVCEPIETSRMSSASSNFRGLRRGILRFLGHVKDIIFLHHAQDFRYFIL